MHSAQSFPGQMSRMARLLVFCVKPNLAYFYFRLEYDRFL
jgi:hypothetical protein